MTRSCGGLGPFSNPHREFLAVKGLLSWLPGALSTSALGEEERAVRGNSEWSLDFSQIPIPL